MFSCFLCLLILFVSSGFHERDKLHTAFAEPSVQFKGIALHEFLHALRLTLVSPNQTTSARREGKRAATRWAAEQLVALVLWDPLKHAKVVGNGVSAGCIFYEPLALSTLLERANTHIVSEIHRSRQFAPSRVVKLCAKYAQVVEEKHGDSVEVRELRKELFHLFCREIRQFLNADPTLKMLETHKSGPKVSEKYRQMERFLNRLRRDRLMGRFEALMLKQFLDSLTTWISSARMPTAGDPLPDVENRTNRTAEIALHIALVLQHLSLRYHIRLLVTSAFRAGLEQLDVEFLMTKVNDAFPYQLLTRPNRAFAQLFESTQNWWNVLASERLPLVVSSKCLLLLRDLNLLELFTKGLPSTKSNDHLFRYTDEKAKQEFDLFPVAKLERQLKAAQTAIQFGLFGKTGVNQKAKEEVLNELDDLARLISLFQRTIIGLVENTPNEQKQTRLECLFLARHPSQHLELGCSENCLKSSVVVQNRTEAHKLDLILRWMKRLEAKHIIWLHMFGKEAIHFDIESLEQIELLLDEKLLTFPWSPWFVEAGAIDECLVEFIRKMSTLRMISEVFEPSNKELSTSAKQDIRELLIASELVADALILWLAKYVRS